MVGGFKIGRIFGITIRIDWSWLIIFVLITWNLATVFGDVHTSWGPGLDWGLAVIASFVFFGSVLAHEIAHSLVARARGIPVKDITLFLFGGVSSIQQEPKSPGIEFVMAIAGPLTSIVLGVIMVVIAMLVAGAGALTGTTTQVLSRLGPVPTALFWLGFINVLLGVFNLIPGFPLDGGRVFRSILWAITNNMRRATQYASYVGRALAWAMIIVGVLMIFGTTIPFLGTGILSGVWLAFIGWFLNSASTQSYQQVVIEDVLKGIPVDRIMRRNPPTVPASSSVYTLVHEHIMGTDDQSFPVMDGEKLVGLVTLEDVRKVPREEWEMRNVQQIMTPADKLHCVTPEDDAAEALTLLAQRDVRQLPVLEHGELVGLLRRQDIVRYMRTQHANLG